MIILIGAIPATILGIFGLIGIYIGVSNLTAQFSIDPLLLIIAGSLGVWGTVGLWRAALHHRLRDIWLSLAAGQVAIFLLLSFSTPAGNAPRPSEVAWLADSPHWLALVSLGPTAVIITLIIRWASES